MSDGHDDGHDHEDAADAHDDHGFDGEPAKELGPEEPMTPMWLPGLGAAIFVVGAILMLTRGDAAAGSGSGTGAAPQKVAAPIASAGARPPMERVAPRPMPERPGAAQPAGSGSAGPGRKLSTDQLKELQKRIKEAQEKKQADGAK